MVPKVDLIEAQLNLEPSSSAYIVDLKLPTTVAPGRGPRRAQAPSSNASDDFRRAKTCATASSIFRRSSYGRHRKHPRSLLWRVLDDDTVLSIRSADVTKPNSTGAANLILNLKFSHPVRPACIAFCDSPEHDAVHVFILDTANQLYNLILKAESFRKRSVTDSAVEEWCRVHVPNALNNFKIPYRLVAVNEDQVITTLSDGGLIRLDRNKAGGASGPWKETFYNAKGWTHSFKTMLSRGGDMDVTAAAAAVQTDFGYDDTSFLFTVCLDHRLRIWNLHSGQIANARDLLDAERSPQETGKWQLDPAQTNLLRVIDSGEGRRMAVTYSPIGNGEFKFWKVEAQDKSNIRVTDHLAGLELVPRPPLGNDVWTLADFIVKGTHAEGYQMGVDMWVLWKNNMAYRVQYLSFAMPSIPQEHAKLRQEWQNGWSSVIPENSNSVAPESGPCDATDVTEKWLAEIFAPGRFPKPTIEAALGAYERAIGRNTDSSSQRKGQSLAESICTAVGSTTSLTKLSTGDIDHEQFRTSSETQWRRFYRILIELDKPRGEALALSFSSAPAQSGQTEMPWIVCADRLSTIRQCNDIESICNRPDSHRGTLTTLISTGRSFIDGFSEGMLQVCQAVLRAELFEETTKTDHERIQFFSDKAAFWRQISDEDCALVTDALGSNFNTVSNELYKSLLSRFNQYLSIEPPFSASDFGRKAILKSTLDLANLHWNVCFSQIILLVHMEFEFDQPQDALHNRVDIGYVYRELLRVLKRLEFVRQLANTEINIPVAKLKSVSESFSSQSSASGSDEFVATSALELSLGHLMAFSEEGSSPRRITEAAVDICAPDSSVELVPELVQCSLLVQDRPDLALDLSPFCSQEPFSTYVQGRVHLAVKDFAAAADNFRKAAFCLSAPKVYRRELHSGGLLDSVEWEALYAGLPRYYSHIVALFEKQKAYSYVVEFSRLALQFINKSTEDADNLRLDMQSRLFGGATQLADFQLAHTTLVAIKNRRLQHGCLHKLVTTMCDNMHSSELVKMTFPGLESSVDEILELKCADAVDVVTGIPYHQILYAWRIKSNNYRGAAAVLLDRIQKLRELGEGDEAVGDDVLDTAITRQYLMLINVLSCVDVKQAWITTTIPAASAAKGEKKKASEAGSGDKKLKKEIRRVVTLADIRKEYQDELDRIAAIQNNQFGFEAGDEMEIL